jgi:cytochrome c553
MKIKKIGIKANILKKILLIVSCILVGTSFGQILTWTAPASADKLVNPLKGNAGSIAQGKVIYQSMCVVCHGKKGNGNGSASVSLSTPPANFLSIEVNPTLSSLYFDAFYYLISIAIYC